MTRRDAVWLVRWCDGEVRLVDGAGLWAALVGPRPVFDVVPL